MANPTTEAITAVKGPSIQGQASASVGGAFRPLGEPSRGNPSANGGGLFPRDTVEISDAARAAVGKGGGAVQQAPKGDAGSDSKGKTTSGNGQGASTQNPDAGKAPVADADNVNFHYDPQTNTLQTQVVDPKTGKAVQEIPSDDQIKLQQSLRRIMKRQEAPSKGAGSQIKV